MTEVRLSAGELLEAWPLLSDGDRVEGFSLLARADAEFLFDHLDPHGQSNLLSDLPAVERRLWIRFLAPDDAADLIQEAPTEQRTPLLELLDETTRGQVAALLAYAEDEAGGLMNPRYARLRPDMSVNEAIGYLRQQNSDQLENLAYPYVLDAEQRLLGVVSLRRLVASSSEQRVHDVMNPEVIAVDEAMDQEEVSNVFAEHDLVVIPVLDDSRRVKGIVTVDDIVDVVREEATEDMQKIGGTEALDAPYLHVNIVEMVKKRVVWLAALLVLGFLAVLAIRGYSETIETLPFLAFFVPLIIASGGNSGTQAATLVVRAIALGEVRLRDWWRVMRRELAVGLTLGAVLGALGFAGVVLWAFVDEGAFGGHAMLVGATIATSILAVALWGTLAGSMLPLALRGLGFDPASASAPLVATIVDVSGLVIYFSIAGVALSGTLL